VAPKRRLPVLQTKDGEDSPQRPRWEWIVFGAALMIVLWLPLASVVALVLAHGGLGVATLALPALSIALSFLSVSYVVGRWGKRGPGDAVASATLAMLLGLGLTWVRFGMLWEGLIALLLALPSAFVGARLGGRRRGSIPPS
jgi:hypothetical protein